MAKAKVFEHCEITETWRAHAVTIWIRAAVTDGVKSELAFRRFNSSVRFAHRWPERADLHLRIHNRSWLNLRQRLFQDLDALPHLQRAHHQSIIRIAMFAQRNPKFETRIKSVAVHFANVVVHAARAQHWAGNSSADREIGRKFTDVLRSRDYDLISKDQFFKFIEKFRETIDDLPRTGEPIIVRINSAATEAHVVAHHSRAGERFEQVENFLALAERVHERRTPRSHVAQQKPQERRVVLQSSEFGENDAQVFAALRNFDAGEFLYTERVGPVVAHRTKVIEPICVRHRAEISCLLTDLLVIAVQITENRLELTHDFPVERDVHAKDTMRRRMLRPHRVFEQLAFQPRTHGYGGPLHGFESLNCRAHLRFNHLASTRLGL